MDLKDQARNAFLETEGKCNIYFSIKCVPSFLNLAMNDELDDGFVDFSFSKLYFVVLAIDG